LTKAAILPIRLPLSSVKIQRIAFPFLNVLFLPGRKCLQPCLPAGTPSWGRFINEVRNAVKLAAGFFIGYFCELHKIVLAKVKKMVLNVLCS
jgi:hypothetical protein